MDYFETDDAMAEARAAQYERRPKKPRPKYPIGWAKSRQRWRQKTSAGTSKLTKVHDIIMHQRA